jgi:hypothetical protein
MRDRHPHFEGIVTERFLLRGAAAQKPGQHRHRQQPAPNFPIVTDMFENDMIATREIARTPPKTAAHHLDNLIAFYGLQP